MFFFQLTRKCTTGFTAHSTTANYWAICVVQPWWSHTNRTCGTPLEWSYVILLREIVVGHCGWPMENAKCGVINESKIFIRSIISGLYCFDNIFSTRIIQITPTNIKISKAYHFHRKIYYLCFSMMRFECLGDRIPVYRQFAHVLEIDVWFCFNYYH